MIGATRSRVSFFMNKFRKLGLIDYNGRIEVHNALVNAVLLAKPPVPSRAGKLELPVVFRTQNRSSAGEAKSARGCHEGGVARVCQRNQGARRSPPPAFP